MATTSSKTTEVKADVEQTGTTNREVQVDRDVEIHWWKAEYDDTVEHRIGREDREQKVAKPEKE